MTLRTVRWASFFGGRQARTTTVPQFRHMHVRVLLFRPIPSMFHRHTATRNNSAVLIHCYVYLPYSSLMSDWWKILYYSTFIVSSFTVFFFCTLAVSHRTFFQRYFPNSIWGVSKGPRNRKTARNFCKNRTKIRQKLYIFSLSSLVESKSLKQLSMK